MPLINVKMTIEDGGLSVEQKGDLVRALTDAFVRVVGRGEKTCVVIIDELSTDNYAIGGETITAIRAKQKS
ncbi:MULTISPECIES: tautomerase family protein [unclassified Campylobacter]|uniref:tautomerase family protein n=1 Tax=unclassified Campylobacter TaxID=2593542 RepID=UPI0022E9B886|nr:MULTISPECIES: 4-oxalocrotonate tautomerase family protein [unclassified Campylobacter]MDA3054628.1 4-oxalocrotonate tautomerase family protein [Campylobacter sp. VBCF_07 NA4]MDA3060588.1 4-oxalocrotonate tautomerase family protein [Campylobacter sp. VBCF_02 NA5]MDA3070146.1 4-oxalocrotonate tautomerase family protein [Campylobacter sp. VBCF_08 NA3]WBR54580.1 4-oxalocrotonate tautomerase family protein [Campylobacter sp. VBCF_01 NA2]